MTIIEVLQWLGIPAAFGRFTERQKPPYMLYTGAGQEHFVADNKIYTKQDQWQVEYYFIDKDIEKEHTLEDKLISEGFMYEKSEDVWIEDEGVFIVYYTIWQP